MFSVSYLLMIRFFVAKPSTEWSPKYSVTSFLLRWAPVCRLGAWVTRERWIIVVILAQYRFTALAQRRFNRSKFKTPALLQNILILNILIAFLCQCTSYNLFKLRFFWPTPYVAYWSTHRSSTSTPPITIHTSQQQQQQQHTTAFPEQQHPQQLTTKVTRQLLLFLAAADVMSE